MDTRTAITAIVEEIAETSTRESRFLTPNPRWLLDAEHLLLFIGKLGAIPEDEVARIFDAKREEIEKRR